MPVILKIVVIYLPSLFVTSEILADVFDIEVKKKRKSNFKLKTQKSPMTFCSQWDFTFCTDVTSDLRPSDWVGGWNVERGRVTEERSASWELPQQPELKAARLCAGLCLVCVLIKDVT